MKPTEITNQERLSLAVAWVVVLWLCITISWFHYENLLHMLDTGSYLDFRGGGQEDHPALYRILVPSLFHLLPERLRDLSTHLNPPLDNVASIFQIALDSLTLFLSFVFFVKAVNVALRIATEQQPLVLVASWLLFVYVIVFSYIMVPNRAQYFPYDFTELFFVSLLLYFSADTAKLRPVLFPATVFVATLNKETAIFFVLIYLIFRIPAKNWKQPIGIAAAAVVAGALAKLLALQVAAGFASENGPGAALYLNQLSENIAQLRNPLFWFAFTANFGFLWVALAFRRKDITRTQWLLCGAVVIWVGCMFVAGISRALRVYGPMGIMLAWMTLVLYLPALLQRVKPSSPQLGPAG